MISNDATRAYRANGLKYDSKILIDFIILLFGIISFIICSLFTENVLEQWYGFLLSVELVLFLKINKYRIVNVNTAFVVILCFSLFFAPIIYIISGREITCDLSYFLMAFLFYDVGLAIFSFFNRPNNRTNKIRKAIISPVFVAFLLYAIALISALYYLYINRTVLLSDLETGRVTAMSGNGLVLLLIKSFVVSCSFLYCLACVRKIRWVTFWLSLVIAVFATYVTGFKANCLTIVIVICLMHVSCKKLPLKKIIFLVVICSILIIFLDYIRSALSEGTWSLLDKIDSYFTNGFYNYQRIYYWFPKNTEYQYGYTYLIDLKMLLPGPDEDFTLWLKSTLNMSFSGGGVTPTIVGEVYMNFSVLGIIIGFLLLGILSGKISLLYNLNGNKWYVSLISWQFIHAITGGISNVWVDTVLFLIIGYIATLFMGNRFYDRQ